MVEHEIMDRKALYTLAENIIAGKTLDIKKYQALANMPDSDVFMLLPGADMIREQHFGQEVHLCMICNGKSGQCSEDCSFCSQSVYSNTDAPVYPLLTKDKLQQGAWYASQNPVNRYSIVTTGKRLPPQEVATVAEAMAEINQDNISLCASLGILGHDDFLILKKAGISRYHHNLETCRTHFNRICTTHTYQERIDTIKAAKKMGFSVCCGGIFGLGETDQQVLELALALKDLDVDAVPINFLVPIKGTPLENFNDITPLRCLKIIALFRYILPDKDIIVCGGREANLKELHSLIFYAGASGIMTGDYLTTTGRGLAKDLQMIEQLQFSVRKK